MNGSWSLPIMALFIVAVLIAVIPLSREEGE